jgi:hypothetical protein
MAPKNLDLPPLARGQLPTGRIVGLIRRERLAHVIVLIERSFDMFRSPLGTWLPFLLIFLASFLTGIATQRKA